MKDPVLKTALFESHKQRGARFIDFAGWKMPFSYAPPREEHLQVRKQGGLFDVSHMGEIRVKGKESLTLLQKLLPTPVAELKTGQAQYSVLCNEEGGLIDDLIVYALLQGEDYLLCVNAGHKEKDYSWIQSQCHFKNVSLIDESEKWGLIAVQGPQTLKLCEKVFPSLPLSKIKKFHFIFEKEILFSATGYTGEVGLELYIPWSQTSKVWEELLEEGQALSFCPVGLGARDTLRLEMAYLLAGQDFDESRTAWEAGLSWLLKNPKNYIGKESLLEKKEKISETLRGFMVEGDSGVPRRGYAILSQERKKVGEVTSGTRSPSLEKMIGMAYIKNGKEKDKCFLEIHGSLAPLRFMQGSFLKKT